MGLLLTVQSVSKTFGAEPLFESIAFTVLEGSRIGLIGPNGAGKSTLLGIIAGRISPDDGEVVLRKGVTASYVAQDSSFEPGLTIREVLENALHSEDEMERLARISETSGRAGFDDLEVQASSLSGGWRKRLAIAEAMIDRPDVLLLDEPTNHLDLDGILWLERLLRDSKFASIVVSHDRYFLENVATEMIELNRAYASGLFRADGNYSQFLELKDAFLHAQSKHQEALENRVRTELEWLRRGPKARTTKSKARIDRAHELIGELSDLSSRSRSSTAGIDFAASDRRTKRLIDVQKLTYSIPGRTLFRDLSFTVVPQQRIGLVGPNGSGKTTMLRLLLGESLPESGQIERALNLRTVYFDQQRAHLNLEVTLRRALAPDGDSVIYRDRITHVASWAERFLFRKEQLEQPMSRLSGGERARVLIANLMLQPADVLLLDEPTNDLDIETLEILEENLLEFAGALVLVTHDRFLLDRVSTVVIGLDGQGGAEQFADYSQWEAWQSSRRSAPKPGVKAARGSQSSSSGSSSSGSKKKALSYNETRELESIEQRIEIAEQVVTSKHELLEDPTVTRDPKRLREVYEEQQAAQEEVDTLYARWGELEAKLAGRTA
jgi:ATP-binding cassette subfamily F protein uup